MRIYINPFQPETIDDAIRKLESYQNKLEEAAAEIVRKLSLIGYDVAYQVMSTHVYSGETLDSLTIVEESPTKHVLMAGSTALLFFEFGAGLNGYGHPEPQGYGPGTYPGKGHWNDPNGWWFPTDDPALAIKYDSKGQGWGHSKGNPPHMPMYKAERKMRDDLEQVAREVFSQID